MPLTPFQTAVFQVISRNRRDDSFVAGATVINRGADSPRFSKDIDLFHDTALSVEKSAMLDAESLRQAGYVVEFSMREALFHRADVARDGSRVRLEWAADSAFRFFPIVPDEQLGYRLHEADAATNKVLAAAGRQEVRDFIDLAYLDRTYISLGIAIWAACGKDEGYTPDLILEQLRRNCLINPATMRGVTFATEPSPVKLKAEWLASFAAAEKLIATLPEEPFGCLYLDSNGQPARGETFDLSWKPHFGSVKGAWPKIAE